MTQTLNDAISTFGAAAKAKLANPSATGAPEDQLRAPFEQLLADVAALIQFPANAVVAVGESTLADLKTRPDYAVTAVSGKQLVRCQITGAIAAAILRALLR